MTNPVMTKFVIGETSFVSRGVSRIKVGDEVMEIPIKSIGIIDIIDELNPPKPPSKLETIAKDSDIGKALGINEDTVRRVQDYSSDEYLEEIVKYTEDLQWAVVLPGIDVEFTDSAGNAVTDKDEIIQGLKNAGITGHQLGTLARDIKALTSDSEASADFLSGNASA